MGVDASAVQDAEFAVVLFAISFSVLFCWTLWLILSCTSCRPLSFGGRREGDNDPRRYGREAALEVLFALRNKEERRSKKSRGKAALRRGGGSVLSTRSVTVFFLNGVAWALLGSAFTNFQASPSFEALREAAPQSPREVLGVSSDASTREIRKAYRRLSRKYHPDADAVSRTSSSEERRARREAQFRRVAKAYEALTDDLGRANYLKFGNADGRQASLVSMAKPSFAAKSPSLASGLWGVAAVLVPMMAAAAAVFVIPKASSPVPEGGGGGSSGDGPFTIDPLSLPQHGPCRPSAMRTLIHSSVLAPEGEELSKDAEALLRLRSGLWLREEQFSSRWHKSKRKGKPGVDWLCFLHLLKEIANLDIVQQVVGESFRAGDPLTYKGVKATVVSSDASTSSLMIRRLGDEEGKEVNVMMESTNLGSTPLGPEWPDNVEHRPDQAPTFASWRAVAKALGGAGIDIDLDLSSDTPQPRDVAILLLLAHTMLRGEGEKGGTENGAPLLFPSAQVRLGRLLRLLPCIIEALLRDPPRRWTRNGGRKSKRRALALVAGPRAVLTYPKVTIHVTRFSQSISQGAPPLLPGSQSRPGRRRGIEEEENDEAERAIACGCASPDSTRLVVDEIRCFLVGEEEGCEVRVGDFLTVDCFLRRGGDDAALGFCVAVMGTGISNKSQEGSGNYSSGDDHSDCMDDDEYNISHNKTRIFNGRETNAGGWILVLAALRVFSHLSLLPLRRQSSPSTERQPRAQHRQSRVVP